MLSVVNGAKFREYELSGCPLIQVGGLECVSLWRVCEVFGMARKDMARKLAKVLAAQPPLFATANLAKGGFRET